MAKFKPFADIDDFYAICGVDSTISSERITARLMTASLKVASLLELHGIDWEEKRRDAFYGEKLKQVVCSMTARALQNEIVNSDIPWGATQYTTSAAGFSQQIGFQGGSNVSFGELYVTKSEKQLLGLDKQRISFVSMIPTDDNHHGGHHARR